jgi:hypothetical protein
VSCAVALALLTVAVAAPAVAGVTVITATAPLAEPSRAAVEAALEAAVADAVHRAVAMGLRPLEITDARVGRDRVTVQILAEDADSDDPETPQPVRAHRARIA